MIGTVLWYDQTRGFGFCRPDSGDRNVYVGAKALAESNIAFLIQGQRIEFDIRAALKGPEAAHLRSPAAAPPNDEVIPPARGPVQPDSVAYFPEG